MNRSIRIMDAMISVLMFALYLIATFCFGFGLNQQAIYLMLNAIFLMLFTVGERLPRRD